MDAAVRGTTPAELSLSTNGSLDAAPLQAKLHVGAPDDAYEREADRMADAVVSGDQAGRDLASGISPMIQRQSAEAEKDEPLELAAGGTVDSLEADAAAVDESDGALLADGQGAVPEDEGAEIVIQAKTVQGPVSSSVGASSSIEDGIRNKGPGMALPDQSRAFFESGFGVGFDGVRVHQDATSTAMNAELGSRAFAHGRDVYFAAGQYQPGTSEGDRLIAHELTHVVQQSRGSRGTVQRDNGKSKLASVSYLFSVPVDKIGQPDDFLITTMSTILGISRTDARALIKKEGWHWVDKKYQGPTQTDLDRGYRQVRISAEDYQRLTGIAAGGTDEDRGDDGRDESDHGAKAVMEKLAR